VCGTSSISRRLTARSTKNTRRSLKVE
jgi:hypothetical protein